MGSQIPRHSTALGAGSVSHKSRDKDGAASDFFQGGDKKRSTKAISDTQQDAGMYLRVYFSFL